MVECIFCKIISGQIPLEREPIYEDQDYLVIPDKYPKAETHILLMPKTHIHSVAEADDADREVLGGLLILAGKIARRETIPDFKLIFNNGKHAEIPHLHLHLVSGPSISKIPGAQV